MSKAVPIAAPTCQFPIGRGARLTGQSAQQEVGDYVGDVGVPCDVCRE